MLSAKDVVEEACSQLRVAHPLQWSDTAAAHSHNQSLHQQITRTVSGHKRPGSATTAADRKTPSQRACRELFSPDKEQAAPAAQPLQGMQPSQQAPRLPLAEANAALTPRQAAPAQVAQPFFAQTSVPCLPVADSWSLLLGSSGQVLHNRLHSSNLLPSTTATGQQLLELETQLQALLGIRKGEQGTDNICWVDHGFVHYTQGIMHFYRIYGDAECAQVSHACPSSHSINHIHRYITVCRYHTIFMLCGFGSQQGSLRSNIRNTVTC